MTDNALNITSVYYSVLCMKEIFRVEFELLDIKLYSFDKIGKYHIITNITSQIL